MATPRDETPSIPSRLSDTEKMEVLAKYYPEFSKIFMESEHERISYKRNEHAYRRYMEKTIVEEMEAKLPKNLKLDMSLLFKAKSFLSGDFCFAAKFVDDIYLLWLGDSISHGTGSKIVKDIINEIIVRVFNHFKSKHEYNLPAFVQAVQKEFSSPRTVKKVIETDLSDIIPQNDPSSKLGIVIPIIFLQLEKVKSHCRLRLCNRGMPFVLNIRLNAETGALEKCFFYTKKDVLQYTGKYAEHVELIDHSGVPLILDKDIYHSYSRNAMKNKGLKPTEENIVKELFTVSEIRFLPGDLLVIPSDGVMETVNEKGEEYGVVKFIDDLLDWVTDPKRYHRPLNDFKEDYYYSTLRKFTVWNENYPLTGHGIEDDMTVLFIRQKTDSQK